MRVFYRLAPIAQIGPNFYYILGLENSINMKLKPGLRNENIRLHAKFQVDPTQKGSNLDKK